MPKIVDHRERRESIARALWRVVERHGLSRATLREVALEEGVSLGHVQHYFSTRSDMLAFAMSFAAEQRAQRVERALRDLGDAPHPRDVLRLTLCEMLPLGPDALATSRMSAAYVVEALHDPELQDRVGSGLREGRSLVENLIRQAVEDGFIPPGCDVTVETDLLIALTGFTTLIDLKVIEEQQALTAIDLQLDRLFGRTS